MENSVCGVFVCENDHDLFSSSCGELQVLRNRVTCWCSASHILFQLVSHLLSDSIHKVNLFANYFSKIFFKISNCKVMRRIYFREILSINFILKVHHKGCLFVSVSIILQ